MYLNFFHLRQEPFQITPDPAFLFLSPSHKEALASIIYGIQKRKGFVAISGQVGVGKTTIVRSYLASSHRKKVKPIYVFNANISFKELLKTICCELGIDLQGDDLYSTIEDLHKVLIDEYKEGHNIVLIIDEAQNMPVATLEQLRMLSNLETNKDKLIQIILVGQPELNKKLNLNELRQLKQRIAIRATITPLTQKESFSYIQRRLGEVMLQDDEIFTKRALKKIVQHAEGIPRVLNILCDNALIAGYGYQKKSITLKIAKEVINDFEGKPKVKRLWWRLAPAAGLAVLACFVMATPHGDMLLSSVKNVYVNQFEQMSAENSSAIDERDVAPEGKTEVGETEDIPFELRFDEPVIEAMGAPPVADPWLPWLTASEEIAATTQDSIVITLQDDMSRASLDVPAESVSNMTRLATGPPLMKSASIESFVRGFQRVAAAITQGIKPESLDKDFSPLGGHSTDSHSDTTPPTLEKDSTENPGEERTTYPLTRSVKEGDNLSTLCVDVYGFTNNKLIEWVKGNNPRIEDPDRILVGDKILFPEPPLGIAKAELNSATEGLRRTADDLTFIRIISDDQDL